MLIDAALLSQLANQTFIQTIRSTHPYTRFISYHQEAYPLQHKSTNMQFFATALSVAAVASAAAIGKRDTVFVSL